MLPARLARTPNALSADEITAISTGIARWLNQEACHRLTTWSCHTITVDRCPYCGRVAVRMRFNSDYRTDDFQRPRRCTHVNASDEGADEERHDQADRADQPTHIRIVPQPARCDSLGRRQRRRLQLLRLFDSCGYWFSGLAERGISWRRIRWRLAHLRCDNGSFCAAAAAAAKSKR